MRVRAGIVKMESNRQTVAILNNVVETQRQEVV